MKARGKWIGRLLLTTTRQSAEAPRIDGCSSTTVECDDAGRVIEQRIANGYAIRLGREFAIVIGWRARHHHCPRTPLEAARWQRRHWVWVLQGRPKVAPMGAEATPRGTA